METVSDVMEIVIYDPKTVLYVKNKVSDVKETVINVR